MAKDLMPKDLMAKVCGIQVDFESLNTEILNAHAEMNAADNDENFSDFAKVAKKLAVKYVMEAARKASAQA